MAIGSTMSFGSLYLSEGIFHTLLYLVGLGVTITAYRPDRGMGYLAFLASAGYLVGLCAVAVVVGCSIQIGVKIDVPFLLLLLATALSLIWRRRLLDRTASYLLLGIFGIHLIIVYLALCSELSVMSYDSYKYVILAKKLVLGGRLPETLAAYSLTLPALQGAAIRVFGVDFLPGLIPTAALSFVGTLLAFLWHRSPESEGRILRFALAALLVFSFCVVYFMFISAIWLMPNLLAGILMALALMAIASMEVDRQWWILALFLPLLAFSWLRVEGFVTVLLVIAVFFKHTARFGFRRDLFLGYWVFVALNLAWFLFLYLRVAKVQSDFFSQERAALMAAACLVLLALPLLLRFEIGRRLGQHAQYLLLGLLALAALILLYVSPERFAANMDVLHNNLLVRGLWGDFWIYMAIMLSFLIVPTFRAAKREPLPLELLLLLVSFVLLLLILFQVRSVPMRLGFGDSANRMLLHMVPTLLLYVGLCATTPGFFGRHAAR